MVSMPINYFQSQYQYQHAIIYLVIKINIQHKLMHMHITLKKLICPTSNFLRRVYIYMYQTHKTLNYYGKKKINPKTCMVNLRRYINMILILKI